MSRRLLRAAAASAVLGTAGLGFLPVALADTSQTTLTPTAEAWYQPNPTCAQASGCVTPGALPAAPPAAVPLSPYPAGTLHVGYTGGAETARSYLALPVDSVTGTLRAATLTVPLDIAEADGSTQPDTAHLQACLVTSPITPADGSVAEPPKISCDTHAVVKYLATPAPHLEADLAPLLQGLLTTDGIVLLPDGDTVTETDAWRVVFSAHNRADAAKTAPATITLTLDTGTAEIPVNTPPATYVPPPTDTGFPVIQPAGGTGFAAAPEAPAFQSPAINNTPAVAAPGPPAAQPATNPVAQILRLPFGAAYPAVWLLPIALLVLVPYVGRALLSDLTPTEPMVAPVREPAT